MLTRFLATAATIATLATATPVLAQSGADARFDQAQQRFDRELSLYRQEVDRLRQSRSGYRDPRSGYQDPRDGGYRVAPDASGYADERDEGDYDAARYYRPGSQERVLTSSERVYAGEDGRYYCKRTDGTTGLIVGAVGGGVLGNVIDGGRSRTVGTLLGAAVGGLAGRAVEQQQQIRCR